MGAEPYALDAEGRTIVHLAARLGLQLSLLRMARLGLLEPSQQASWCCQDKQVSSVRML